MYNDIIIQKEVKKYGNKMTPEAVARIQSATAKSNGGKI